MKWELQPLKMTAYACAGGNNEERYKTKGYGRLLSCAKVY